MEEIVFILNSSKPEEITWKDYVYMAGADETTTPRGVAPRLFVQEIEIEEEDSFWIKDLESQYSYDDIRKAFDEEEDAFFDGENVYPVIFTISSWGIRGNQYKRGDEFYSTRQAADDALFEIWEETAINNDQYSFFEDLDAVFDNCFSEYDTQTLTFLYENNVFDEGLFQFDVEVLKYLEEENILDVYFIDEKLRPGLKIETVKSIIAHYKKKMERIKEKKEQEKVAILSKINELEQKNSNSEDNILRIFFADEFHPAPQVVCQIKKKSGLSWSALRKVFKNTEE